MNSGYSHIVIGAGAIGSAAAYWLSRAGAERVLVIEQFDLVHGFGSSGDHSRIIRHAYHSSEYTALTPAMFTAWQEIEERSTLRLYVKTGGIDIARAGTSGHRDVERYKGALSERGIPFENITADDVRQRYPQWTLDDDVVGMYQEDGGLLDIRKAVSAMTSMAMAQGVTFLPRTAVNGIITRDRSVTVNTSSGSFDGDNLVVAAGSWTPEIMADLDLDLPITLSQEQVAYVASPDLRSFTPDRFPVWLYHGDEAGEFYGFPVHGEAAIKISRDLRGEFIQSQDRRFQGVAEEDVILVDFLRQHLPGAVGPVLMNRTCVYDLTPDRDFILDTLPGRPHVVLFCGAGHAGKFASLVGSILSDIVTEGKTEHPIEPFRLDRPGLTDKDYPPVFALRERA